MSIESKEIPLKVKPAGEVFDFIIHEREKKEQKEALEFVTKLKAEIINVPKEDQITDEIGLLNLDKKVLDKVNFFLNEAYLQRKSIE
jgi:hypothetical protein